MRAYLALNVKVFYVPMTKDDNCVRLELSVACKWMKENETQCTRRVKKVVDRLDSQDPTTTVTSIITCSKSISCYNHQGVP